MELSPDQTDALTELINIGYGRAAGALSELTGYRISLEVPQVAIHEIDAIGPLLTDILGSSIVSVNQMFSGPVSGNALLLLNEESALVLSRLLSEENTSPDQLDSNARETVTEVGNILLNACLGVFGNLLLIQVNFSVPMFQMDEAGHLIRALMDGADEKLRYGLMIHTRFHVKTGDVTGYLVIVLGIESLDRLMHEIGDWENRQAQ